MNEDTLRLTGRWCPPQTVHHRGPGPPSAFQAMVPGPQNQHMNAERGMKSVSLIIKNCALSSVPLIGVLVYSSTPLSTMKLNTAQELGTPELTQVCNEFGSLTP